MSISATTSRAVQRRLETASRITALSRRFTADRGLAGFTIEEVCDEVGVSRRTFFNYFPSKEEAVLGVDEVEEMNAFGEHFLARGSRGWPVVIDDIVELATDYMHSAGLDTAAHLELIRAIGREPRLLARFVGMGRERDVALAALIAKRESVQTDDPRVRACVTVISALMRSAGERLFDPDAPDDFGLALSDSLAAIRAVLDTSPPRKARQ
ncbi:TetR family transcriptional regulator [Glaciihabitans tibetensis]|uniref:TetR family transcriptional regulator n=1 Tax=Glaciihabitans tibetensis TaxID=1266600 RepID=A0A2T0V5J1_9MICO|nr:TetR family transcriptional regulator [Glaciihabitans tibetensis]PRY65455.1 TetR family transcriptional regulator [Glaciihabitans tibetensis]